VHHVVLLAVNHSDRIRVVNIRVSCWHASCRSCTKLNRSGFARSRLDSEDIKAPRLTALREVARQDPKTSPSA